MAVEKTVVVPVDPDEAFAMLTDPERLRRWQAVTARVDLRVGGEYRFTIVPGHSAAGTIEEVEPGKRLVYTWGWEGDDDLPPGASVVTITLEPTDEGTEIRLVHEGLNDEQSASHGVGWDHYLGDRLVALCRTGVSTADEWAAPESYDPQTAAEASAAVCMHVLRGVSLEDGIAATPCAKFDVDGVVTHLLGSIAVLGSAAGPAISARDSGAYEDRVAEASGPALEAWAERGVDGTVHLGSGEVPAALPLGILAIEFLVHAWDCAVATKQECQVNDALAGYVLEQARGIIKPEARDGDQFADEVPVSDAALSFERLIAFTGRAA
jgi:uncharacterized protein (TIGR03086 family)